MNPHQQKAFETVASAASLSTPHSSIEVEQTPTYLKEPVQVADLAVGVMAAFGASVAELGVSRGMPSQDISLDRRHATLSFNDANYHYINGVVIQGGEITVPVNGIYETRDGKWMCFNGAYPHLRNGILKYFGVPLEQEALIKAVKKHDSAKIEQDFERLGLCVAPMHTKDEWLAHPQGQVLAKEPIISFKQRGNSKARVLPEAKNRPLEGVRVIDCTHVIAGPWLSRQLVEHGADCISIRNAGFAFLYPGVYMESYDKKQILLDFKTDKGLNRFVDLIKEADVLVWGYHSPALDRLGLTTAKLEELNPNLVLMRENGYGLSGPWANRKGWEQLAQTTCGAAVLASEGRDGKHIIAALPCDYGTGYIGATAVASALRMRQEQGGFWEVLSTLCHTAMLAVDLPHEHEEAVPVSMDDMKKYLIDQDSPDLGGAVYSRLAPVARLSKTPAFCATGPANLGQHDPMKTTWGPRVGAATSPPHRPSEYAEQGLEGFLAGYGHEDLMPHPD